MVYYIMDINGIFMVYVTMVYITNKVQTLGYFCGHQNPSLFIVVSLVVAYVLMTYNTSPPMITYGFLGFQKVQE